MKWCWHNWSRWIVIQRLNITYTDDCFSDGKTPVGRALKVVQERRCGKCGLTQVKTDSTRIS
jgi:hypothetical protein